MENTSHEVVESPVQAEILGRAAGVIVGMFVIGLLALISVVIFAVKLGENIMNYGS